MKILKINWYGHPVLRDFELCLTKNDGTPYDTVILAGENGSGKTKILESMFDYFSKNPLGNFNGPVENYDARITLDVVLDENDGIVDSDGNAIHRAKIEARTDNSGNVKTQFLDDRGTSVNVSSIAQSAARAIFSQIAINYNAKVITATTGNELDKIKIRSEKSPDDLATEITQLLIDIYKDDSGELAEWVETHRGVAPTDEVLHKRMRRFSKAFDVIFDNLKFKGVQGLKVMFEKNNHEVSIDQLSSGEKQIVFRGGFLLRNQGAMNGATVLLDEPELSMHPKWQEKILDFYRRLFTDDIGSQKSQIFIATHSDHILKNALNDDNALIVKLKYNTSPEYIHKGDRGMILKTVTLAEIKWRIFDLPTTDFHDELWAELSYDDITNTVKNVATLDAYLVNAAAGSTIKLKEWKGFQSDSTQPNGRRANARNDTHSLPAYIRNYTHHPEFTDINNVFDNVTYTDEELRTSIQFMIDSL